MAPSINTLFSCFAPLRLCARLFFRSIHRNPFPKTDNTLAAAFLRVLRASVVYFVSREIIAQIIIRPSCLCVFVVNLSSVDEKRNYHGDTESTEKKAGLLLRGSATPRETLRSLHQSQSFFAFVRLRVLRASVV